MTDPSVAHKSPDSETLTGITDPKGSVWVNSYDSLGRRFSAVDPDLGTWLFTYDAGGRMTFRTDAIGLSTAYT